MRTARSRRSAALPEERRLLRQCHNTNGAVDKSFVQFYPTLLPIARAKHSLNAAYVAAERSEGS